MNDLKHQLLRIPTRTTANVLSFWDSKKRSEIAFRRHGIKLWWAEMHRCSFQYKNKSVAKLFQPGCNSMDVSLLERKCFVPHKNIENDESRYFRSESSSYGDRWTVCIPNWGISLICSSNVHIYSMYMFRKAHPLSMYQINSNLLTPVNHFPASSFASVSGEWVELLGSSWMVSAIVPVPSSDCWDDCSTFSRCLKLLQFPVWAENNSSISNENCPKMDAVASSSHV